MNIRELHQYLGQMMNQGTNPELEVEVADGSDTYSGIRHTSVYVMPNDNDPEVDRLVILPRHWVEDPLDDELDWNGGVMVDDEAREAQADYDDKNPPMHQSV
jgi:hypothetical protein